MEGGRWRRRGADRSCKQSQPTRVQANIQFVPFSPRLRRNFFQLTYLPPARSLPEAPPPRNTEQPAALGPAPEGLPRLKREAGHRRGDREAENEMD